MQHPPQTRSQPEDLVELLSVHTTMVNQVGGGQGAGLGVMSYLDYTQLL